ncbi:type 1 glutamine amidotransferase [Sinorhizobium sp. BG8]|uniref:type 1 glutamine amidotransferase n=1 Tax=Sinorhizobium sp. BG8 TaxID=2613773 RepID=UPI00193E93C8|nr:type 1 glutamine amidotransferase [Sinorhizobium sp. BG8]QRM57664.1 type 1 glutamine amidotransferase [Sinorhizobium sp. BG8]
MNIGILQTGSAPESLADAQGDYDARMRWLLGENDFSYVTYKVEFGELPASPEDADGWIITGSRHGVYEDHAWLPPLEDFIRRLASVRRPLIGICFGHQVIAKALGGKVEKSSEGWIAGPQLYECEDGRSFAANAWHQDQVVELPQGARPIARSESCAFAALHYPGFALSVQPHPEFTAEYFEGLLDEKGHVLPETIRETARHDSVQGKANDPFMRQLLRDFMRLGDAALVQ